MAEKNSNKRPNTDTNNSNKLNLTTPTAGNAGHFPSQRYSDSDMSSSEQEDSTRRIREADRLAIHVVQQENVVLKMEVETLKLRVKNLLEENKKLRQDSINIVSTVLTVYNYR